MWTILKGVLTWFGAGPLTELISGGVDAYKSKLAAGATTDNLLTDLAGKELMVQTRELELQAQIRIAEIGKPLEPDKLAEYIVVAYMGKVIVWDNMLGLGTTDAIKGAVAVWVGMVITYMFGKRGAESVARILQGRWK